MPVSPINCFTWMEEVYVCSNILIHTLFIAIETAAVVQYFSGKRIRSDRPTGESI